MYVQIHDTCICTRILTKYRARKSIYDGVIYLYKTRVFVKKLFILYVGSFYNVHCLFPSCYPKLKLINQYNNR